MSEIKDLTNEMTKHIQSKKDLFDSIRYSKSVKERLHQKPSEVVVTAPKESLHTKTKSELYGELKDKFKLQWKSTHFQ